ncbi:MAG: crotonobetainyl-CoA:carnitine CoA-transferase CaiB-like acyl-CoA transferase [Parasphingorhabdus sp.]|jgi:crotonobetainyl-CoA:carnitine CoA-transferase CaiB-like acyl-CoA transferase
MIGPLEGCRVIEMAHIMAGPIAGMMLADMGADVIKIEKPDGDDTRRMVPPTIESESAAFMMLNRNKRGIVLDLKQSEARKVALKLLSKADVVVENYRRGTMEKLGLGYETLKEINPAIVYCEVSGFGRTGPYKDRGGFDLITQGMSGLMSVTGESSDRPPVKVGAPVTDITAGILAAMGISAAWAHRLQTGKGQKVDTSLFEAGITQTYWQSAIAMATGESPGALGSAHPLNAPYQAFKTADGWINIGAANQANWERMLTIIDRPELQEDSRFKNNAARMSHLEQLVEILNQVFVQGSSEAWLERFEQAGVPAGPILSVGEMHANEQTLAREMVIETEHPVAGMTQSIGMPVKFSETPGGSSRPAPLLGQHSKEVLMGAGYSELEITNLVENGDVIQA